MDTSSKLNLNQILDSNVGNSCVIAVRSTGVIRYHGNSQQALQGKGSSKAASNRHDTHQTHSTSVSLPHDANSTTVYHKGDPILFFSMFWLIFFIVTVIFYIPFRYHIESHIINVKWSVTKVVSDYAFNSLLEAVKADDPLDEHAFRVVRDGAGGLRMVRTPMHGIARLSFCHLLPFFNNCS